MRNRDAKREREKRIRDRDDEMDWNGTIYIIMI